MRRILKKKNGRSLGMGLASSPLLEEMKRQRKGNEGIKQEEKKNRPISMHRTLELMPLCRCSPSFLSLSLSVSLTRPYNNDDKQRQQKENQANAIHIYI